MIYANPGGRAAPSGFIALTSWPFSPRVIERDTRGENADDTIELTRADSRLCRICAAVFDLWQAGRSQPLNAKEPVRMHPENRRFCVAGSLIWRGSND